MQPALGWTVLSRAALRRAEAAQREQSTGVRDEIGVQRLHQGYADRFFALGGYVLMMVDLPES